MTYDRADWHYEGDFPSLLPKENGGTHIGMFITWIIQNDLIGETHIEDSKKLLEKVKSKQMTGREFFFAECNEKFWDTDLTKEGNEFTQFYYADEKKGDHAYGQYLVDYENILGISHDSLYEIEDSWDNYDKLKPILDDRFHEWRKLINRV